MHQIKNALISVYYKDRLDEIAEKLHNLDIKMYSTGGTWDFINRLNIPVVKVETLTSYPSILGGRVKTLHPKVFGGILARREMKEDVAQLEEYQIPEFDLVIVDLYPFEETLKKTNKEEEIIEKIDIGGISLIRAAAKNFKDVLIVSHSGQYDDLIRLLIEKKAFTSIDERKRFAAEAFDISSHYDTAIFNYFNKNNELQRFKQSLNQSRSLRYGENPHQDGVFYGHFEEVIEQLHGKEISYNNLVDIDAAINLINEFNDTTFVIIKHTNACGVGSRKTLADAWKAALAGDPVSAFGGVFVTNKEIDLETAQEINKIFFEVLIAPSFEKNALELLKSKKNRILLQLKSSDLPFFQFKSVLNGVIVQEKDQKKETADDLETLTAQKPSIDEINDLLFANVVVKHTKSNAIVLVKNKQLIGSGIGQTSRVDALKQAITKAKEFKFDLKGAVMASDAFFPFADSVEIANKEGINAVIQPGGSIRDEDSIKYCDEHQMVMVFTGIRHFKH